MSTLRVSNIEAKADASSPTVDEKLKITNSNGDVIFHLDGKTSGITTVGINTTGNTFTVDSSNNVTFSGSVTSSGVSTFSSGFQVTGGSVGIGTDNPYAKLDLRGGVTQDGGESVLLVASSDPINIPSTITQGYSNGTLQVFGGGMSSGSRRGGQIDFVAGQADTDPGTLIFRTGTANGGTSQTERVRITSAGLVGIGRTDPGTNLDIAGNIRLSAGDAQIQLNDGGPRLRAPIANTLTIHTGGTLGTDDYERLRIDSSGNVGINSASPKTNLDISQQTGAVALPQGTTAQRPSGTAPYIRWNTSNSALEVYNGTDWVEIITDYFPSGSVILG